MLENYAIRSVCSFVNYLFVIKFWQRDILIFRVNDDTCSNSSHVCYRLTLVNFTIITALCFTVNIESIDCSVSRCLVLVLCGLYLCVKEN